jgi:hypothetical protein
LSIFLIIRFFQYSFLILGAGFKFALPNFSTKILIQ